MAAITSFINPFDIPDKTKLYCLSSGATTSLEIERDVLRAEEAGKEAKEQFIRQRLETKEHFFEPLKKLKLKTMGNNKKTVKIPTIQNKIIEYRHQGNVFLQLLMKVQKEGIISVNEFMTYPLTPVPYSLATADGYFIKTDKAKGFQFLIRDLENDILPPYEKTLTIEDGNALFHYMRELPDNFKGICLKLFDMKVRGTDVIFSTDTYQPNSVKSVERKRRGCGEKLILHGEMTKRPSDWKAFLANDENKTQLTRLLLRVWSKDDMAEKYENQKCIVAVDGQAYCLYSADKKQVKTEQIQSLSSNQEETDSRIVLYCKYAQDQGYEYVRVRSPDSDVFFILLHHASSLSCKIIFDTGTGNNKRLINMTDFIGNLTQEYCTALTALHAFTHCDSTSAFKGIGKVKPIKVMQKNPRFQRVLAKLGEEWCVSEEVVSGLEAFTCAIYGRSRVTSVDELRCILIQEKCESKSVKLSKLPNVDLYSFPPCKRALQQHIFRANYQMAIWRRASEPIIDVPNATDGHGWTYVCGEMVPLWYEGNCLPQILVDDCRILNEKDAEDNDSSSEDESNEDLYELTDSDFEDDY